MGLLHSDLKDKKIEPVDPADVTIALISDAFLLLEYIGSDITYIGDGYMLCVLFSMLYSSSELPKDLPWQASLPIDEQISVLLSASSLIILTSFMILSW